MDAKVGAIVGGVLAAALLVISAMNMGNIGSVKRKVRKLSEGRNDSAKTLAKVDKGLGQVQEDLMQARTKLTRLEARVAGVESAAEAAARAAAKSLVEKEREAIVAEAVEKAKAAASPADLGPVNKRIAALRDELAKLKAENAKLASAALRTPQPRRTPQTEPAERRRERPGGEGTDGGGDRNRPDDDTAAKARDDFRKLFQKRRDGDLTDEQFREEIQKLREKYPDIGRGRGGRGGRGGGGDNR